MEDFNPVTLYFILHETIGSWLWPLVVFAATLVVGILVGTIRLRRAGRSPKRPVMAALAGGTLATAVALLLTPGWTLADFGSLTGPIDYLLTLLLALVPGAIVGAVLLLAALNRCAAKAAKA
ncbi:DUF5368 family protein [Rhizobium sp. ARZ01]|uniref:DUF5368 family protein n=1 Tax=Rhizobium sp. ARZ01 TaxID=2769313 RepID=UPI0017810FB1|nr:DUF5368 family protein [Rhizobium sp. ARZ01]MBD9373643.1 DUF5368 family protein [Rhizobium sp. ARZ01]